MSKHKQITEKTWRETANVVRLEPTPAQTILFEKNFGACRWLYNYGLELKQKQYKKTKKSLSNYDMHSMIPLLAKQNPWLNEVESTSLRQSLSDMNTAYQRFFKKQSSFPQFKSKHRSRNSFRVVMGLDTGGEGLHIGKHGWVKCRGLRLECMAADKLQSVTVYREAGKYYASILYREELDYPVEHVNLGSSCGIDIGIAHPATVVDDLGRHYFVGKRTQQSLKELEKKRKTYQRRVDRKMKGSNRREKARLKVQRVYQMEKFVRKDFNHKLSNTLARKYETVVMEDLNLRNMTRSAKGCVEKHGKNVAAKAGLNRELLRMAPGQLYVFIKYKVLRYGGKLVLVNPAFTSQTCHECGTVDRLSRKNQATFKCTGCGHSCHADVNAARNIRCLGLAA